MGKVEREDRRKSENGEVFTVMLPSDIAEKLRKIKKQYGISYSAFIKLAIADEIAKIEAEGSLKIEDPAEGSTEK